MNLQLVNPFAQNFPERVDVSIDACAQCVSFNGAGTSRFAGNFVAIGRNDGGVSVLDLETKGYLRFLDGHVKAVSLVQWSRNARYLLTASRDWNVIVWDLLTGDKRNILRFDAPVTSAAFHPRNSYIIIVTLQNCPAAILVDLREEYGGRYDLETSLVNDPPDEELLEPSESQAVQRTSSKSKAAPSAKKRKEYATTARFTPRGDLVFVGTSQGMLHIYDTQTKILVHSENISSPSSIKGFDFDRTGTSLVVNSNDRCIRVYAIDEDLYYSYAVACNDGSPDLDPSDGFLPLERYLVLEHRFQDLVNRTPWNAVKFSNDGEYIVGGAGHKAAHQIYVWDRANGSLAKILEGPKDCLDDLDWHPVRPIIASASDQGLLHIWVTNITERYSAYAPGFEELEENLEYQEREDEFDVEDESEVEMRKMNKQEVVVDIANSERPPRPDNIVKTAEHSADVQVAQYLASSNEWADEEIDEDCDQDFSPPLDVDLREYDLDESEIRDVDIELGVSTGRR